MTIERLGRRGRPIKDDDFLLLINAHNETIEFPVPQALSAKRSGETFLDTSSAGDPFERRSLREGPVLPAGTLVRAADRTAHCPQSLTHHRP